MTDKQLLQAHADAMLNFDADGFILAHNQPWESHAKIPLLFYAKTLDGKEEIRFC